MEGTRLGFQIVAVGSSIRGIARLRRQYGPGRWRKLKGNAVVRLPDGTLCRAEVHWCESHGMGMCELKVKPLLEK